jgi:hypothetical protein
MKTEHGRKGLVKSLFISRSDTVDKYTIREDDGFVFDFRFMCGVEKLEYDYLSKTGTLHMSDNSCTDMSGCIGLFKCIDQDVNVIHTIERSGRKRDTSYIRDNGKWASFDPSKMVHYGWNDENLFPAKLQP